MQKSKTIENGLIDIGLIIGIVYTITFYVGNLVGLFTYESIATTPEYGFFIILVITGLFYTVLETQNSDTNKQIYSLSCVMICVPLFIIALIGGATGILVHPAWYIYLGYVAVGAMLSVPLSDSMETLEFILDRRRRQF